MVKALERAEAIKCLAMQVFVKGNTRWEWPAPKLEDAREFKARLKDSPVQKCVAHAIYLVNLCATNAEFVRKSIVDMVDEIERCDLYGIPGVVMHPGAHCGAGVEQGIEQIAAALDLIFERTPKGKCRILLETTAGQGSAIGGEFTHIADIIARVKHRKRLGVCVDTCHLFAAGHDLRTRAGYDAMWTEFDRVIGLDRLAAIHLNDSKKPLGSHVDRHEHIGQGELGIEPFRMLLNDMRLRHLPMILETEKDPDMKHDRRNLKLLRGLVAR
jgi:deoxyribonuclease IV